MGVIYRELFDYKEDHILLTDTHGLTLIKCQCFPGI